jgi:hypothetical protein
MTENTIAAGKTNRVQKKPISSKTRSNWLIDAAVFFGALFTLLSGIYFLFLPIGGSQGGRNATYDVTILFDRLTWEMFHTWGGVAMILAVVIHFAIHWKWVVTMTRRVIDKVRGGGTTASSGSWLNLIIDAIIGLSFLISAVSGIYFLYVPVGGYQGGRNPDWEAVFIFNRTTWDVIHTWAGVIFILAAVIHFVIHWKWVVKVTKRVFDSIGARRAAKLQTQPAGD